MRIGVDLDGVVANFTKGWTTQYEAEFGKKILEKDITEWGLSKPLTHFEEEIDFWKWAKDINGSSIFRNLDIYEDSLEVLYDLSKMGHEIVIISSKPWWSIHDTLMWLGRALFESDTFMDSDSQLLWICNPKIDTAEKLRGRAFQRCIWVDLGSNIPSLLWINSSVLVDSDSNPPLIPN